MTLGDRLRSSLERMLEWRTSVGYANDTYRYTLSHFLDYLDERWPDEPLLTAEMVDGWLAHHRYASAGSQGSFVSCLREFARFLRFEGSGDFLPGPEYSPGREAYQPYLFTDAELLALFDALDSVVGRTCGKRHAPEMVVPVWSRLLYCCGMRPQEPPSLLRADVDLETGDVYIRQSKRHKDRHIMVSDDMRGLMGRYDALSARDRTMFFEDLDGRPYKTEWYEAVWRRAVAASGVDWRGKPRPYDLRHAFCSRNLVRWMDEGRDAMELLPALSAYVGHSELTSTLYYIHLLPERLRNSPGLDWASLSVGPDWGVAR